MSPIYFTFRSLPKPHSQSQYTHHHRHRTFFVDTTTKGVRDRGLDHAVEREKNLRPMISIKNLIKSEPSKSLPISIIAQNRESLMIPTRPIDFIRKYPSIFEEYLPGGASIHPHVRLTEQVLKLDADEELMYQCESYKQDVADRLLKLLMLVRSNKLPLNVIDRFKWDLGLPHDYQKILVSEYPDYFNLLVGKNLAGGCSKGLPHLELVCWRDEMAISSAMKKKKKKEEQIAFPMHFSRGFEMDNKLSKWIDEWQKLPYVSPYENAAHLSSNSDESEKWVVGVVHELLHILVPKKTERENLLYLGESLGLRSRFKQALYHHPGIFYLSNKIGTFTVVLKEGYKRGVLIEDHPLMEMRGKYIHLMNTVKEDSKLISVAAATTQEKKKKVDPVAKGNANGKEEEELEGELCDSSDAEVEYDDLDGDSDEEDEDQSQKDMVSNIGRRAKKTDLDGTNTERGRSGRRRPRKSDFDVKAPSRNVERGRTSRQHPGKSRHAVTSETSRTTQTDVRHNDGQISRERINFSQSKGRSLPDKKARV